ncbi:FCD domain-containing protein [Roseinatronobacter monicus]
MLNDGMQRANRKHQMIVDACKSGQADMAADLTRQHIRGAQESLSRYWQK